jgi:hypothetical protein
MSRRNKVIAYFIGIFISVGFPAFGGGGFFERPPVREPPWREHPGPEYPGRGDLRLPPSNGDDISRLAVGNSWLDPDWTSQSRARVPRFGIGNSWLDPDWTSQSRARVPIVIDPPISPDE